MQLTLGGSRTDSTPRDEVSDELRRDGVEHLRRERQAQRVDRQKQGAAHAKTAVDVEGTWTEGREGGTGGEENREESRGGHKTRDEMTSEVRAGARGVGRYVTATVRLLPAACNR